MVMIGVMTMIVVKLPRDDDREPMTIVARLMIAMAWVMMGVVAVVVGRVSMTNGTDCDGDTSV